MLVPNMIVDNRYKILDEIGRGGMSIIYRAAVEGSGRICAIKEVRKDGRNADNIVRQNLIAEIETLKEIKHAKLPRIADVIDYDDSFIIVMDYIEGVSLDKIISESGAQSEENIVDWAKQLCEVLSYLHSKNMVYCDMKPSNIMLKKNGEITIIDFGTARKYESASEEIPGIGTVGFAAPEQYGCHGHIDARTDIFCLGMTMYALLTGINPRNDFLPEISGFSPRLNQIIQKCIRKNPDERYQSCEELLYCLEQYKEIEDSQTKKIMKVSLFIFCLFVSLISGICGSLLYLSRICFMITGIAFPTSVLLFFLFDIPELFNELTGHNAGKFIAETINGTQKSVTTKLIPTEQLQKSAGNITPAVHPDAEFFIIEEFSFTSSAEIIDY